MSFDNSYSDDYELLLATAVHLSSALGILLQLNRVVLAFYNPVERQSSANSSASNGERVGGVGGGRIKYTTYSEDGPQMCCSSIKNDTILV